MVVLLLYVSCALAGSTPADRAFEDAAKLRDAGRKIEALRAFSRAARLNPDLPFVHREIGLLLLDRRDFKGAAAAFRAAAARDRTDAESRYNLALSLANDGLSDQGLKELSALKEDRPDWALPWFGSGHIYVLQGRAQDAEEAFRKAVELDPKLYRAQFELGKLLEQKGDREGAIKAFDAGTHSGPDSAAARFRLAKLLRQAGRPDEANREFAAVRELRDRRIRGEQSAVAYRQGLLYAGQKNYSAALRELKRALELRPDFPELPSALAATYEEDAIALEKRGDSTGAIKQLEEALKLIPSAETENHLGVLLGKQGLLAQAMVHFRRALDLQPGFQNARKNLDHVTRLSEAASSPK